MLEPWWYDISFKRSAGTWMGEMRLGCGFPLHELRACSLGYESPSRSSLVNLSIML